MSIDVACDKCSMPLDKLGGVVFSEERIKLQDRGHHAKYHLCVECFMSFEHWVKGRKRKGESGKQ